MSNEAVNIQNPFSSEYVSQLLDLVIQNLAGTGVRTEVTRKALPDKKSSLIIEATVGLGVSATWDLIKFAIAALSSSRRAAPDDKLTLNGKRYTIREIEVEQPSEADSESDRDST